MPPIRIVLCRPSHPGNIGAAAREFKGDGATDAARGAGDDGRASGKLFLIRHTVI